jgi:uncharacterized protein (DUF2147 family)
MAMKKEMAKKALKGVAKRAIPGIMIADAANSARKGKWKDVAGSAAWITVPTGVAYEVGSAVAKDKNAKKAGKALSGSLKKWGK